MDDLIDARMRRWRELSNDVAAMVRRAEADSDYRAEVLAERGRTKDESQAAWLMRCCAHAVIPSEFLWEVIQAIGGKCFLSLQGYVEREVE